MIRHLKSAALAALILFGSALSLSVTYADSEEEPNARGAPRVLAEAPRWIETAPLPEAELKNTAPAMPEPVIESEGVPLPEAAPIAPRDETEAQPRLRYLGEFQIYGYDICEKCCLKTDGITASGAPATVGRTVAVNGLPFGTVLYIDGVGERVVEDRGGLEEGVIDVLCADHAACYAITGIYDVYIVEGVI